MRYQFREQTEMNQTKSELELPSQRHPKLHNLQRQKVEDGFIDTNQELPNKKSV
jgi:hypothetical protein